MTLTRLHQGPDELQSSVELVANNTKLYCMQLQVIQTFPAAAQLEKQCLHASVINIAVCITQSTPVVSTSFGTRMAGCVQLCYSRAGQPVIKSLCQ